MIDPHVHCRDGEQSYKETISHVFQIADSQGVEKIFDMPNTSPPILYQRDVKERLKLVPKERIEDYYLYIGATSKEDQLKEAVQSCREISNVIGIKMFGGKSVGDLEVASEENQKFVYQVLSDLDYRGVIAVHCEKEDKIDSSVFDPDNPITHSLARPKEAEIESLKDQIYFVKETGFKGTLHIVHVSCVESVNLIMKNKDELKITCGVTPHHILWSNERMKGPGGLLYKMNPPLREKKDVLSLRKALLEGKIDWIETDHAPHQIGEKLFLHYSSGFPSLFLYGYFVNKFLPELGLDDERIQKLTLTNISKTFELNL